MAWDNVHDADLAAVNYGDAGDLTSVTFAALLHPSLASSLSLNGLVIMFGLIDTAPLKLAALRDGQTIGTRETREISSMFAAHAQAISDAIRARTPDGHRAGEYLAAVEATRDWLDQAAHHGSPLSVRYEPQAQQVGKEFIDGRWTRFGSLGSPYRKARRRSGRGENWE